MEKGTGKTLIWVECMKVFAAFLIVMQHSISYEWTRLITINNIEWKFLNFVFMIARSGVPIFFMCSGIGMLARERNIKDIYQRSIWGIVKIYVSWMLIYGIYDAYILFCENLATPKTIINAFIKDILFGRYHTWFVIALIGLYAITPFLYLITRQINHIQYFLLLSIAFTILFPYIERYDALSRLSELIRNANMHFVVGYSLYFVIGYYLSKISITPKVKALTIICLLLSITAGFLLSCKNAMVQGSDCQVVYGEFSITGFILNTSILLSTRILFEERQLSDKAKSIIKNLSSYGIGVYMLHPLFLFLVKEIQGIAVIFVAIILWIGMLCIMKLISFCPVLNTLLLQKRKGL